MANWLQRAGGFLTRLGGGTEPVESSGRGPKIVATNEAYRWARRDRRTDAFQPPARSGDAAITESHDLMHRRVRAEAINNSQVKRIVQVLAGLVVGRGVQTFSWPFGPWESVELLAELESAKQGVLESRLRYALESDDVYEQWWLEDTSIDVERKRSGPDLQRDLLRECIQVGHGLLLRVYRPEPGRRIPLCYQLIEREQLDYSVDRPAGQNQNKVVGGVEIDPSGRRVAYWLYDAHPHDSTSGVVGGSTRSTRVPAERVIDLCLWHRPSANIGASWLDAIGQKDFDRDQFLDAEIRAAAKGALLALIHKSKSPYAAGILGMLDGEDASDGYGNEEVKLGLSPLAIQVGVDEDVAMVESNRPTAQAGPFFKLLDRDIAAGVGLSYYSLTGDYESTSYSSVRAAKLDEDIHIGTLQQWFALHVAIPMRREFNSLAVASGLIESVKPAEFNRHRDRYQRFDAIGAGRDLLDPLKETDAAMARLRGGLTTLKLECAKRGLHWIKVLMQQAVELRIAKMYGVPLDWSKGQGGNVAAEGDEGAGGDKGDEAGDESDAETVEAEGEE